MNEWVSKNGLWFAHTLACFAVGYVIGRLISQ